MAEKVRVVIEFEVDPTTPEREIVYTLMDALSEFQSARHHDGRSYVNKRYPDTSVYSGKRREEKIQQVNRRISLAERMRCGINYEITKIDRGIE
jgi:hypothetical protein